MDQKGRLMSWLAPARSVLFADYHGIATFVSDLQRWMNPIDKQPGQLNGLDWLRGAASLMVCLFHVKKYVWGNQAVDEFARVFDYGYLGVYMFFVVSGFVIPYSLDRSGYTFNNFFRFLLKRLTRIQPPYILLLLLLLVWNYGLHQWKGWGSTWLYDWKKFLLNATYLVPFTGERWIFSIFWTLAVEFQYYVLIGLLFVLMRDRTILRYMIYSVVLALSFVIPIHYQTVLNHGVYFLVGFQTFLFYAGRIRSGEFGLSVFGALVFIGAFGPGPTLLPVALSVAGILFVHQGRHVARFMGSISYSLYLIHGLAGAATALLTIGQFNNWIRFGLAVAVSIVSATLYYRLIETPFLRMSKRIRYG